MRKTGRRLFLQVGRPVDDQGDRREGIPRIVGNDETLAVARDVEASEHAEGKGGEQRVGRSDLDLIRPERYVDGDQLVARREIEDFLAVLPPARRVARAGRDQPLAAGTWKGGDVDPVLTRLV